MEKIDLNDEGGKQAGAELGQAQPKLRFWENDLSVRGYIWGRGLMARGLK